MFENSVNLMGNRQRTFTVASQATTNPLQPGVYDVWADGDVFISVAKTRAEAQTVTVSGTTGGYLIRLGQTVPVQITEESWLGAAGSATNVFFHKVK